MSKICTMIISYVVTILKYFRYESKPAYQLQANKNWYKRKFGVLYSLSSWTAKMKGKIKKIFKLSFSIIFLWFSCNILVDFFNGKIIYEILKEKNVNLQFPSLTLCPSQDGALAPLKVSELKEDVPASLKHFNLQDHSLFIVLQNITNPIEIVKNFSFTEIDAKIGGNLM